MNNSTQKKSLLMTSLLLSTIPAISITPPKPIHALDKEKTVETLDITKIKKVETINTSNIDELQSKKSDLETSQNSLKAELDKLNQEKGSLQSEQNSTKKSLSNIIDEQTKTTSKLKTETDKVNNELSRNTSLNIGTIITDSILPQNAVATDETLKSLSDKTEKLEKEKSSVTHIIQEKDVKLKAIETTIKDYSSQIELMNNTKNSINSKIDERQKAQEAEQAKQQEEANKKAEQEALQSAKSTAEENATTSPTQTVSSLGYSGSAYDAFLELSNQLGLTESQKVMWAYIINHESTWNVTAMNPSGAYGLGQALPASKMAAYGSDYLTNPKTQLKWMFDYMNSSRYGGIEGAYAFWLANHWY